jgi:hypothetical protein
MMAPQPTEKKITVTRCDWCHTFVTVGNSRSSFRVKHPGEIFEDALEVACLRPEMEVDHQA